MNNAEYWIKALKLDPHPEGGYFRETYRSQQLVNPEGFSGLRSASTGIFFLLPGRECSHFHRIQSDELWHFHCGSSLSIHVIAPDGSYAVVPLGPDAEAGASFQAAIPAECWFGATVNDPESYSLVGCTVAPGFDFHDFELAKRKQLLTTYPAHTAIIERLTSP